VSEKHSDATGRVMRRDGRSGSGKQSGVTDAYRVKLRQGRFRVFRFVTE